MRDSGCQRCNIGLMKDGQSVVIGNDGREKTDMKDEIFYRI